ncbi:inositol/phosphatidylinositol phosphatase [Histoplasma capsulatum]|uniref:Inositol/phosphatidylinositol phosphatase n=1 Tax=Ajellomyces capsulatus TaxID=5037 RepID=A0A8A1MD95_AJECA|nr:conserved hypothetical protein [Histoplasma mississippiense (nom. inval.)]EDN10458.1 conserved hypothetical protein [Histoplasma mississippiense (nom. inval.)]QSS64568.1 inositol/phosphatidylinositol phosphatase [Histoplasma capsulatum]
MPTTLPFRDINLLVSPSQYAFRSASSSSAPTLVVERPTGDLRLENSSAHGAKRVSSIAGILGMIKLKLDKYIILISKTRPVGRLRGHMVYKVVATEFLPLRERYLHDPDEDAYLNLLKQFIRAGPMYFSYSLDITNSFQRQSQSDPSLPLWKRADDRFFWNRFIQTDLIDFRSGVNDGTGVRYGQLSDVDPFILPVMFGMMNISSTKIKSTQFTFALITRRSRHRGGTRYFSRGINEQGHVSNFNETEQVVILNDSTGGMAGFGGVGMENGKVGKHAGKDLQVLSFVQTRGSVPLYWSEVNNLNYTPLLQVRSVDSALNAARRHFLEQIRIYGENYLVNLVNQKGREEKIKSSYEQMIRALVTLPTEKRDADTLSSEKLHAVESTRDAQEMDHLHYVYFDFHSETKGLQWHRAELLLERLTDGLLKGQYFRGIEVPGDSTGSLEIRTLQTSVVRTNCMDCLDRTNVVQSMLARWTLTRQLLDAGVLQPGESTSDDSEFEFLFRNMWADNADIVSKSYSGTGALKTDFTRTGQRTKAGILQDGRNSVTRYVLNNFLDGPKQDAFDLFLGAYLLPDPNSGDSLLLADQRPLAIRSVPYILGASIFMISVSLISRRLPDSAAWPLRLFLIVWLVIAAWCVRFIYSHGMLYVNWPKLNTPAAAAEGYLDALGRARNDKIIGQFINTGRHQRGVSNARVGYMEEGKTRIE